MIGKFILITGLLFQSLFAGDIFSEFFSAHQDAAHLAVFPLENHKALAVAIPNTFKIDIGKPGELPLAFNLNSSSNPETESIVLSHTYATLSVSESIKYVKSYFENEFKNIIRSELKSFRKNNVHIAQYFCDSSDTMSLFRFYQDLDAIVSIQYTIRYEPNLPEKEKGHIEEKLIDLFDSFGIFDED